LVWSALIFKGHKIYSLWDAYPHADLITYPSLYEGFGNALLETIYFKRLAVVNRYPVYNADIKPLGFEFIEMDGFVDDQTVEDTKRLLKDPTADQLHGGKELRACHGTFFLGGPRKNEGAAGKFLAKKL
jgi:mannosylglucosylglycerate synthase